MFILCRGNQHVHATGVRRELRLDATESVDAEVSAFFQSLADDDGPKVLVGALPFDARQPAMLYQPESFMGGAGKGPLSTPPGGVPARPWCAREIHSVPSMAGYADLVRKALRKIEQDPLQKVVLSRQLRIKTSVPVDPISVAQRLAHDPSVATFLFRLPPVAGGTSRMLVGASPELLVSRSGRTVRSHPLAGSAARSSDPVMDRDAAESLLRSDKDRREHMLVVEEILDLLSPHCTNLEMPEGTGLHSTATMWHLGTKIEGLLKEGAPSAAGLATLLHPTPAIGGTPRKEAVAAIHELEPHDRGFYSGAFGWTDSRGDGKWHITLRCAEICGAELMLYAGAGIVAGSDPDMEVAETAAKFRAMLKALEMDESAGVLETVL